MKMAFNVIAKERRVIRRLSAANDLFLLPPHDTKWNRAVSWSKWRKAAIERDRRDGFNLEQA